ncbi:MAG: PD-(D/E)XK nuclease family protein [Thermodesulfovibrionales bacterium]|nr:PD-(D/E)XK nuclease family protein [Thermodesulfovibrionales bacterium]
MNSLLILNPEEDIIEKVFSLLIKEEGNDYSKNLIVFPGKRPAHYLRKLIAEKEGKAFIPPSIFSIDEFVNFIFNKTSDSREIHKIDALGILYGICLKKDFLQPQFRELDTFYNFGERVFRALEELYIENISVERIRSLETLIEIPQKSADHLRFLSEVYSEFYKELVKQKLSTRSLRYRTLAETDVLIGIEHFKSIILAGFFAFTWSEKEIIKKLLRQASGRITLIFHDGEDLERSIESIGLKPELRGYLRTGPLNIKTSINLYSIPDLHGEVKLAGTLLKDKKIDEKTVIVLPEPETLFPLLRHGIPFLKEEEYNISMGYPVTRTPLYGFFLNLFELVTSMDKNLLYVPDYLKFMLHPYTKNIQFKGSAELNRITIHYIEDLFHKGAFTPFTDLDELEEKISKMVYEEIISQTPLVDFGPEDIKNQLRNIHDKTIRKFLMIENIGDFAKKCIDVIDTVYKESTAKLHPLFYPYTEAFVKEFKKVSLSEMRNFSFKNRESYFNFFKKIMSSIHIPFEGTPLRGLQILGFLETRNIKFKRIFFLDLNEGVFPDLTDDTILPYPVRKALNLPTYQERERLLYYYFKNLLSGAEEVSLFYLKNKDLERSRFIEKIIWEGEKVNIKNWEDEKTINYKIDLRTPIPHEIEKTEEILSIIETLSFNASSLENYLSCGLRFYYSDILQLSNRKNIAEDPERKDTGFLVHDALHKFFEKRLGETICSPLSADLQELKEIEDIVIDIFTQRYGYISGRIYLMMKQIIRRLREFIPFTFSLFNGKEIVAVEDKIEEWLFNAPLNGRIDLVLKEDSEFTIIDYKISSKNDNLKIIFDKLNPEDRSTWYKAIKSLQIPFYMILYSTKYRISVNDINGYYLLLGKSSLDGDSKYGPFSSDKIKEYEIMSNIIRSLIDEIKDPNTPFMPPMKLKDECPYCDYKPLCGTEWVKRDEF